jgi:hypothetical protein
MGFGGSGGGGSSSIATSTDVALNVPADNQVLSYDGTSEKWINSAPTVAGVNTVNTRSGDVTLTKSDVGLANVDNTSDANKPVSSAMQAALDLKADIGSGGGGLLVLGATDNVPLGTPADTVIVRKP